MHELADESGGRDGWHQVSAIARPKVEVRGKEEEDTEARIAGVAMQGTHNSAIAAVLLHA